MRKGIRLAIALATCSACMLMPFSAAANQQVYGKKELYELRTLAGQFQPGFSDGSAKTASLFKPTSIIELDHGGLLISDTDNHRLRMLEDDQLTTYSGLILDFDDQGNPIGAYHDGRLETAFYNEPGGLAQDSAGNIYVADSNNHSIRLITAAGEVKTIAGNGLPGDLDGSKQDARFFYPSDIAIDQQGNIYVADTLNHTIRKIDQAGKVTTLNMRPERVVEFYPGMVADAGGYKDGKLSEALFNEPSGLAVDRSGNLYVSDTGNQRIRYIDFAAQTVTTVAGGGEYAEGSLYVEGAYQDGAAGEARFSSPMGITVAADGSLLIADRNNHAIRMLTDGNVYTLAGQAAEHGKADGILSAAMLNEPSDVIELSDGSLAVADANNNKIRIIQRYKAPVHEEDGLIHVIIEGELLQTDVAPQIFNGRTYVPLRALADKLGYAVSYNQANGQVSLVINEGLSYRFSEDDHNIVKQTADGDKALEAVSITYQNRLLIPVRFVTEQLGFDVQWDASSKHVVVRSAVFTE